MEKIPEELKNYYTVSGILGEQHFGTTYKCVHIKSKKRVLITAVYGDFHSWSFKIFPILFFWLDLQNHANVQQLYYVHRVKNQLYIVYEQMDADLPSVCRSNALLDIHVRYITYSLLRLLKFAHSGGLIFHNLVTEFIGINEDSTVKLSGFVEASLQGDPNFDPSSVDSNLTHKWYSAPEQLCGTEGSSLSPAVDMWALGCIIGELIAGTRPPFATHNFSTMTQLGKIVEFLGFPTEQDLIDINSKYAAEIMKNMPIPPVFRDLSELYPNAAEDALDLIKKLFQFSPKKRITAEQALKHKFVAEFSGTDSEEVFPFKITVPFAHERLIQGDNNYSDEILQQFITKLRNLYPTIGDATVLAYNIARSSDALTLLPAEMWQLIFKFLEFKPFGVTGETMVKQAFAKSLRPK